MNNDENGYYMPIYMCKLCGEILVGVKEKITDKLFYLTVQIKYLQVVEQQKIYNGGKLNLVNTENGICQIL